MGSRVQKLLYDMLRACEDVEQFCQGRDEAAFASDRMLIAAVERQLTIVGEALYQISQVEPGWETLVTEARAIVRFRHILSSTPTTWHVQNGSSASSERTCPP